MKAKRNRLGDALATNGKVDVVEVGNKVIDLGETEEAEKEGRQEYFEKNSQKGIRGMGMIYIHVIVSLDSPSLPICLPIYTHSDIISAKKDSSSLILCISSFHAGCTRTA